MASWYRQFILECATVAEPLTRLFRTNIKWHWEDEQQEAFESLKRALSSAPILAYPLFNIVGESIGEDIGIHQCVLNSELSVFSDM